MLKFFNGVLVLPQNMKRFDYFVKNNDGVKSLSKIFWDVYMDSRSGKIDICIKTKDTYLNIIGHLYLGKIAPNVYGWFIKNIQKNGRDKKPPFNLDEVLFLNVGNMVDIQVNDFI